MNDEAPRQLPSARTGNGRVAAGVVMVCSIGLAVIAVIAGRAYKRPEPTPDQPPPGLTTKKDPKTGAITLMLEPTAPQWAVIEVAAPGAPEPRWTEPIPARVVFDESRTSRLGAPLAGRVNAVFAERGQSVKAGAPLYSVSSQNLADLTSTVKLAEVEQETALKNFNRTKDAVNAQVLPGKDLVTAQQKLDQSNVALRLAQQKVSSLRVSGGSGGTASFTVTAPRDGVVVEKTVNVGQTVSPDSAPLIAIADLSSVWVVADIFGSRIVGLTPGTKARVLIGNADKDRDAVIDQVSAVVDPERHTVPVRIKLDNPDGLLRPNAYVRVRLFDPTPTVGTVPSAAVMSDGQHSFVYLEKPKGTFTRRDIEVGSVIGGRVPVTSGLDPTDRVVVQGSILLDNEIALEN